MIKNLTPHELSIFDEDGNLLVKIPSEIPDGNFPRVNVEREKIKEIDNIPIFRNTYGKISNLPLPEEGVVYVVSARLLEASNRKDLLQPGELLRDDKGRVVGCVGLSF